MPSAPRYASMQADQSTIIISAPSPMTIRIQCQGWVFAMAKSIIARIVEKMVKSNNWQKV